MKRGSLWRDEYILWEALALSVMLHWFALHAGAISARLHHKETVEIDITNMGHLGSTALPKTADAPPPKPVAKPKAWVQPSPEQKIAPAPIPTQPVPAPAPEPQTPPLSPTAATGPANGEYGVGTGEGGEGQLSRLPQLLNLSDLNAILQRFYPEQARTERREATVVLDLHIDADGRVGSADIVQSGGADFDDAARRVVRLLKFTPAFVGSRRVAVKMRQAIQFKLES